MNTSPYEAFLKTIELGSLTRAAEVLGYTQSGITHMLNALERDCGLTLLLRDRSGVQITADGQQLLPYFQSICDIKHQMSEKINEMHRLEAGLVRVGTFTSVSAQWLPGMLQRFRKDFPRIEFELLHGTNNENEEWILSGRVDCAFVRLPAKPRLDTIFLRRDPIVAVLPEGHPLSGLPSFPLSALSEHPYIKADEGVDDEISEIFKIHGVTPNVQFSEKDDYAIMAMVEHGLGLSILPELVLKDTSRKIISKALDTPAFRDLGIAFRDKNMLSASSQKFIKYVQLWIAEEYST